METILICHINNYNNNNINYIIGSQMKLLPIYFAVSMFITMLILYMTHSRPEIIIKYPSPKTGTSELYIDDNDVYYKYRREEII